jgi:uncharacterized membrane protein (UPF0127 family)
MRLIHIAVFSIGVLTATIIWGTHGGAATAKTLTIETAKGLFEFAVEVADTDEAREQGLMFRKRLPEGAGMLFNFWAERPVIFWMKNTYVPLDLIFIRADGTVESVGKGVPLSEELVPSQGPVLAVLEVIAGTAEKIGLKPGDKVRHPIFANR